MAVRFKPPNSKLHLSSQALEKFVKTNKNLSKPTPKLWPDHDHDHSKLTTVTHPDDSRVRTLTLTHPILRTLDSSAGTLRDFNQVHTQLIVNGLFQHSLAASRVVKKLCSSSSTVFHAVALFDRFEEPDAFVCNTIVRSLVNLNDPDRALNFYYDKMVGKFVLPNNYSFPILAKVCGEIGSVIEGGKIHARVVKHGFELDLFVRNALIHMYSVCGRILDARKVFDLSPVLDLVTWNSMIDGYAKNGEVSVAREVFDGMPERDAFSWNSMIAGYMEIGDVEVAKELFEKMPFRDLVSWNSLIDGYARVGNVPVAREFFDQMPLRNVVSWNTMLALYVRSKDYSECLKLFDGMVEGGVAKPNEATLVSVLTACAHLGRLDRGEWVHTYISNNMKIEPDVLLSTALLTMYAKCGAVDLARDVFDEMPNRSVVSWNSMIMGHGMHGHGEKSLEMFLEMEKTGVMPNDATFTCILSVCAHGGMILEGWWYFDLMRRVYMIEPKVEHYGCMVDLLSRAGLMKDSEELVRKMPTDAGTVGALLSACRNHSNLELGEIVAKRLIELQPGDIGPYALLSNIYASEGRWDDLENVRKMMTNKGLQKVERSSLIESGDLGTEFCWGIDSVHKRSMLYSMLSEMGAQIKLSCRKYDEL
ncbi:pentatricopeptide repeat (PPR) superfamily protein [Actinidia rufa]|uniref:Pentatricopeptide repeat (PPR) superfamily protein n=1 Tax=Actinidia rufa TaxID=165716 RepID=A0A7J0FTJ9_9ERIC|nr:pentatricopeptide repeat (PPR) superfamily protein [Actinidia rufa]